MESLLAQAIGSDSESVANANGAARRLQTHAWGVVHFPTGIYDRVDRARRRYRCTPHWLVGCLTYLLACKVNNYEPSAIPLFHDHLHIHALVDVSSLGGLVAYCRMRGSISCGYENASHRHGGNCHLRQSRLFFFWRRYSMGSERRRGARGVSTARCMCRLAGPRRWRVVSRL